jgi:hypothetical protein
MPWRKVFLFFIAELWTKCYPKITDKKLLQQGTNFLALYSITYFKAAKAQHLGIYS